MSEPNNPVAAKAISLEPPGIYSLTQLLEDVPLHSPRHVQKLFDQPEFGDLAFPGAIRVHCDHENCEGIRRHVFGASAKFQRGADFYVYAVYNCTDCLSSSKIFGLKAERKGEHLVPGICTKIYQAPPFGQPIPKRLFQVIGESNRENFLQARRAIARGLGIGAYAYYRRIVENTKFELISSVLEIAKATKAQPQQIQLLEKAQTEKQFSKAIEMLREVSAIPAVLLIDGHNPLAILHDVLSEGIHQLDDAECLARAQEAEVILCEVADRIQIALTDRREVKAALSSIMGRKAAGDAPKGQ
jgi:hypothetical protein